MTFNDDDLRRLKNGEMTADGLNWKCPALITRLEAAENAMSDGCECYEKNCYHEKAYQAWRKASGKGA